MIDLNEDIENARRVLTDGGIILYPTDTVWGIGCDARCARAVRRIYDLKRRADSKAMISLVADEAMLARYVGNAGVSLLGRVLPGFSKPVTVIYPRVAGVSQNLLADNGSCGIRITGELFSQSLCRSIDGALVSTSANISGEPTPSFFGEISPEILNGVDYVVSYRRDDTEKRVSSAVVLLDQVSDEIRVLRP